MAHLLLDLLGGFTARLSSGQGLSFPTRKSQALLGYLAVRPGRAHLRAKLAALLWGDLQQAQARNGLRQALSTLRKALAPTRPFALRVEGDTVALDPTAVEVDVVAFERQAVEGTPEALARAAALYQGDILDGFVLRESSFEDWLASERQRLREVAIAVMTGLLAHQQAGGATEAAVETAHRLLALDPLQEPVHRTLMRLYAGLGRRGAALRQYQLCVGVLQRELETSPEEATRRLYQEILRQRPSGAATTASVLEPPDSQQREMLRVPGDPLRETPLVGRDLEIGHLRALLADAWAGRGRSVAIVGEAGIGKSRLVAEVAEGARRRGRVLIGRSYEAEQILGFGPWVDALRGGRVTEDGEALEQLGPVWRAELARLLPELGGLASPSESPDHRRVFESVATLLQHLALQQPLALILEDLHWADEMSISLLAFLGRRLDASAMLVVVTARQEDLLEVPALRRVLGDLSREERLVTMTLAPLSRPHTLTLVRALRRLDGGEEALDALGEWVWATSEGNPFVVVEAVRELHERGGTAPPEERGLPERVQEMIVRRLDRLTAAARRLAAVAAVIGREFEFPLLQRAAGLEESEAASGVEELVRRRILRGAGERFDFTHDRIRETIYRALLAPRRRMLHHGVAEALEALYASSLEPHVFALGVHHREAETWAKAACFLRQAGVVATRRSANREAVACFEEALLALGRLPDTRETRQQAIDLRFDIRNSFFPVGEDERTLDHLREAAALAESLNDHHRLGWALTYISNTHWRMAEHRRALEAGERARAIATTVGDARLVAMTGFRLGQVYEAIGDYRRAAAVLRTSVAILDGELAREQFGLAGFPAVHSRAFLSLALAELGEFPEGIATGEEGIRIAEGVNQPFSLALGLLKVGLARVIQGDLPGAMAALQRGGQACQAAGMPTVGIQIDAALGHALVLAGRPAEAHPMLAQAVKQLATMFRKAHTLSVVWLSEACLHTGRVADAGELGRTALELARERAERANQAYALRGLGEIAAARVPLDAEESRGRLTSALTLADELGMRPLAARCHLHLGELCGRSADRRRAEEHFTVAATRFREMGMRFWLEKAEAARSGTGPSSARDLDPGRAPQASGQRRPRKRGSREPSGTKPAGGSANESRQRHARSVTWLRHPLC